MKSSKIEIRDYRYLAIGLILLAFAITGQSVYVTYKNSYYGSALYRATVDKDDIEQVEILSNWPFDELSTVQQAEGYYSLAISLYNLGQLNESELYFTKVLELSPGSIGEYLLESSTYDYLHDETSLLLAEIALANKDFERVNELLSSGLEDYSFSGFCGTMALMKYDRINRLKTDLAIATKDERSTLELLGWNLFFPNAKDSLRIRDLAYLIKVKYDDEFITEKLKYLSDNIEKVKIVDDGLSDLELYEYYVEFLGVRIEVLDEHGFLGAAGVEFNEYCDTMSNDQLGDCTMEFLRKKIHEGYFYQELIKIN